LADSSLDRAKADYEAALGVIHEYQNARQEFLEGAALGSLRAMQESRNNAQERLTSTQTSERIAALLVLRDFWPSTKETAESCLVVWQKDPEATVRGVAIYTLLRHHSFLEGEARAQLMYATGIGVVEGTPHSSLEEWEMQSRNSATRRSEGFLSLCKTLVGSMLNELLQSRDLTESSVTSPDPKMRSAALILLTEHWKEPRDHAVLCRHIALHDSDAEVRRIAITCLGSMFGKSDDGAIGCFLAGIVSDAQSPAQVRASAYRALYQIRGLPARCWPTRGVASASGILQAIDWSFVGSFERKADNEGERGDEL
jgi:hypothetical protein